MYWPISLRQKRASICPASASAHALSARANRGTRSRRGTGPSARRTPSHGPAPACSAAPASPGRQTRDRPADDVQPGTTPRGRC
ncbi:hypothetical protein G6F24_017672 [Rhizopus arrhizus]|nr:hypothetical protein G6F24_017672 [Rhizopus arrhizus]